VITIVCEFYCLVDMLVVDGDADDTVTVRKGLNLQWFDSGLGHWPPSLLLTICLITYLFNDSSTGDLHIL